MPHVYPIIYRVTEDVPGLAAAGSFVWVDPRVHPSVRVLSFPFANHGRILGLEMDGILERCDGVIAPQLSDLDASIQPPAGNPAASQGRSQLTLVRGA